MVPCCAIPHPFFGSSRHPCPANSLRRTSGSHSCALLHERDMQLVVANRRVANWILGLRFYVCRFGCLHGASRSLLVTYNCGESDSSKVGMLQHTNTPQMTYHITPPQRIPYHTAPKHTMPNKPPSIYTIPDHASARAGRTSRSRTIPENTKSYRTTPHHYQDRAIPDKTKPGPPKLET